MNLTEYVNIVVVQKCLLFDIERHAPLNQDGCHLAQRWHEVQHGIQTGHSGKGSTA